MSQMIEDRCSDSQKQYSQLTARWWLIDRTESQLSQTFRYSRRSEFETFLTNRNFMTITAQILVCRQSPISTTIIRYLNYWRYFSINCVAKTFLKTAQFAKMAMTKLSSTVLFNRSIRSQTFKSHAPVLCSPGWFPKRRFLCRDTPVDLVLIVNAIRGPKIVPGVHCKPWREIYARR